MLAPLSWIKEYVEIKMPFKRLVERLTEIGLAVESIKKENGDIILNLEVTPNRPDWLSIAGIAREIAAICQTKVKLPKIKTLPKPKKILPIKIVNDFSLIPRYTAIIIDNVKVKPSPPWMQERLKMVGLRPINNLVDITNYVMLELGNPLHAFDYDTLHPKQMLIQEAKEGENFTSVDETSYKLPKGAIIIKDSPNRVIDLCGIKGGLNSGISQGTKTVFLHAPTHPPTPIRRTSQALALQSEASFIFERGVNIGGALDALKRAANLILECTGGNVASEIIDLKRKEFKPWKLKMRISRANGILGITIPRKKMIKIFENLNLSPRIINEETIEVTVPTYRGDLRIEEDLIEEVARIYGYNKFPLFMPAGEVPISKAPYARDYKFEKIAKNFLKGAGFTEIYTYSLISKEDLKNLEVNPDEVLKITNPVSSEYEYLRPNLLVGILKAISLNQPNFEKVRVFELGRVYLGKIGKTRESLRLTGAIAGDTFSQLKGIIEAFFEELGTKNFPIRPAIAAEIGKIFHPVRTAAIFIQPNLVEVVGEVQPRILRRFGIKGKVVVFDLDFEELVKYATTAKKYTPIPKYPAIVEDLAFVVPPKTLVGEMIQLIKSTSSMIRTIRLIDSYKNTRTFRISYQSPKRTLTDKEVGKIREKIIEKIKRKLGAELKQ